MNCVNDRELNEYIDRVIGTLNEDQLSELEQSPYPYVVKIQGKVKELIAQHRFCVFDTWLEQDKISCLPNYVLPGVISPTAFTFSWVQQESIHRIFSSSSSAVSLG